MRGWPSTDARRWDSDAVCNGIGESRLQCIIGEKKIQPVREDTSGANPTGTVHQLA